MQEIDYEDMSSLSGLLLIAHPALLDPNFRRTIVLISAHDQDDGALGVVLNRPLGKRLAELKPEFEGLAIGDVPLYFGGPVASEEIILAAWKPAGEAGLYKLFFGLTPDRAAEMMQGDVELSLRGYVGYSGWSSGQLEGELNDNAWLVSLVDGTVLAQSNDPGIWRQAITEVRPELSFMASAPENPSVN